MDSPRRHGDTEEHAEKSKEGFRGCGRLRVAGKPGRALLNIEWGAEEAEVAEKRRLAHGQDLRILLCRPIPLSRRCPQIGSDWPVNDRDPGQSLAATTSTAKPASIEGRPSNRIMAPAGG